MSVEATARRRRALVGCAAAIALLVVGVVFGGQALSLWPADEVAVTIAGLPADTSFWCIVAGTEPSPAVMYFYVRKIDAVAMHPNTCSLSIWLPESRPIVIRERIRWIDTNRVGILRRTTAGDWFVTWFDARRSEVVGRTPIIGRGSWSADLRETVATSIAPDAVRAMGITRAFDAK